MVSFINLKIMNITSIEFHCSRNKVLCCVTLCELDYKQLHIGTAVASAMTSESAFRVEKLLYISFEDCPGSSNHQKRFKPGRGNVAHSKRVTYVGGKFNTAHFCRSVRRTHDPKLWKSFTGLTKDKSDTLF